MDSYYTILIPYVPAPDRTEWHPTEPVGKWSVLSRGCFGTIATAIDWARANLNGTPYIIVLVNEEGMVNLNGTVYAQEPF